MERERRPLTIEEKWAIDIESLNKAAEKGIFNQTETPQCFLCANRIRGNAINCKHYETEQIPKSIRHYNKECEFFESPDEISFSCTENEGRLYGAIFGFCIGDMLGVPVEFTSREERKKDPVKELRAYGTYHQGFGVWSDDSSLMLALLKTLGEGYSVTKLSEYFVKYYTEGFLTPEGKMFDIGISTQNAIEQIMRGVEPTLCGGASEGDNGNGSLMRILPLAFLSEDKSIIKKRVEEVSSITHRHRRSILACLIYVEFVSHLFKGERKEEALEHTLQYLKDYCYFEYAEEFGAYNRILNKEILSLNESQIKSSGYVVDTLEAVLWLFFKYNSYEDIVLGAVNLGGDTDTIAALAGGLAGVYLGIEKIPNRWIQIVLRKNEIKELVEKFWDEFMAMPLS